MNVHTKWQKKIGPSFLIALILGGSLFAFVTDKNYWPFSPYPMYSKRTHPSQISWVRLYAIYEGSGEEVMITENQDTFPMSNVTFSWISVRLIWAKDKPRIHQLLNSILDIHNKKFPDRRIQELRLYWGEWDYPRKNFDPLNPDRRRMVSYVATM